MAQLVEGDLVDVGAPQRVLEASDELGAVKRLAGFGMAEHQLAIARVQGALPEIAESIGDTLRHRHRATGSDRFRVSELAAHVGRDDADPARVEVDVAPAEPDQLALTKSGHRRGQIQRRLDSTEGVVGVRRGEQLLELCLVEKLDPRLGLPHGRPVGLLDRIDLAPPLAQPEVEDRVHGVDVVADRLDGKRLALGGDVAFDVLRPDPVKRLAGKERCDVVSQVRGHGQPMGLPPALEFQPLAELVPGPLHRHALARSRAGSIELAHAAERPFSLGLGQAVGPARGANVADLATHSPAIGPVPGPDPRVPDDVKGAGPVSPTPAHWRERRRANGTQTEHGSAEGRSETGRAAPMYCSCSILTESYLIQSTETSSKSDYSDPSKSV